MPIDSRSEAPAGQQTLAAVSLGAGAVSVRPSSHPRRSNRLNGVLPMSLEWFDGLPPNVRPIRLIEQYPRLVNLVALEWNNPPVAATLLAGLLDGNPDGRDRFPATVFRELRTLYDHYSKGLALNE